MATRERMSADDAAILALESPAITGHTLKLVLLEAAHEPLDVEALGRVIEARLAVGSRGRQRVAPVGGRATDSILDRHIGGARELAFAAAPLAQLKAIGHARPERATVNDVLLTAVAGGLRRWLDAGVERLPRLRAQVPVSLHHRDQAAGELGNRDSFLNVDLPLREPDPLARLDRVSAETARRKRLGDAEELYDFFHALARFKHLDQTLERLGTGPRGFSLSISNVPGPPGPLSINSRLVERLWSVAEPADRHALRVSAISNAGTVGIGFCTDPEALPMVAELATATDDALAELREAAIG